MEHSTTSMRIGVALPQGATNADPLAVRDFAQAAEQLGFAHLEVYDQVVGADRAAYPELTGTFRAEHPFWEPFAVLGYLAGQTRSIELATGVLVLPQRQTTLVAKQAAIVDLLSGGRLRLGVGVGWNPVEFEALTENFRNRGRRSEEQIAVLRALWTEELVTFRGEWHTIIEAGINPLPAQRPIPVWIGGRGDTVGGRVGRIGDGWITLYDGPDEQCRDRIATIREAAHGADREPDAVGLEAWVSLGGLEPGQWASEVEAWRAVGMTHLTVNTEFTAGRHRAAGATTIDQHIALLEQYRDAVEDLGLSGS